ncbi:MAG TPA: Uma2 family endonuclease [Gemmatimonadales bacterium]
MSAAEPNVAAPRRWTAEEVRAMQDESRPAPRYELVDGELLVTPSPGVAHQRAVLALARALFDYVRTHSLGEVLVSPADLGLEPETVVQPDVFVVPARGEGRARSWRDVRALLLAIEVISPSSARADRVRKRRLYQRTGVPEYWAVDLDARVIERWRPADERPEVVDGRLEWAPEGAGEGEPLALDLERMFREVLGE